MENTTQKTELSETEKFFIRILRNFLHREENELPEGNLDWDELRRLARNHNVEGIVYYQLRNAIQNPAVPEKSRVRLFKAFADTCYQYEKRSRMLKAVDAAFQQANLPYLVVKGLDVADFFPVPKLRTTGDIDLLVHEEDKQRAHEILLSLGWGLVSTLGVFEWQYRKDDQLIELHHRLAYDYDTTLNPSAVQTFSADCWESAKAFPGSVRYRLEPNFYFIFLLTHLYKHFVFLGVGFRFFLDLAVIIQKGELDWKRLEKDLASIGMQGFAEVCLAFCSRWFDLPLPVETGTLTDEFYLDSTMQIMENGLFGQHNAENQKNYEIGLMRNQAGKGNAWFYKVLRTLCPPYETVCSLPQYSFVKNKPILLPAVWVYRFFLEFKNVKKVPGLLFSFRGIGKTQIEKRSRFLDQWKI